MPLPDRSGKFYSGMRMHDEGPAPLAVWGMTPQGLWMRPLFSITTAAAMARTVQPAPPTAIAIGLRLALPRAQGAAC